MHLPQTMPKPMHKNIYIYFLPSLSLHTFLILTIPNTSSSPFSSSLYPLYHFSLLLSPNASSPSLSHPPNHPSPFSILFLIFSSSSSSSFFLAVFVRPKIHRVWALPFTIIPISRTTLIGCSAHPLLSYLSYPYPSLFAFPFFLLSSLPTLSSTPSPTLFLYSLAIPSSPLYDLHYSIPSLPLTPYPLSLMI